MPEAVPSVPGISERMGGAAKRVPLRLRILLRVGVLGKGKIPKGKVVRE